MSDPTNGRSRVSDPTKGRAGGRGVAGPGHRHHGPPTRRRATACAQVSGSAPTVIHMTNRDDLIATATQELEAADRYLELYRQSRAKAAAAIGQLIDPDRFDMPLREVARAVGKPESNLRYLLTSTAADPEPAPTEETPPR